MVGIIQVFLALALVSVPLISWFIFFKDFFTPGIVSQETRILLSSIMFLAIAILVWKIADITQIRALLMINLTVEYAIETFHDGFVSLPDFLIFLIVNMITSAPCFVACWMLFSKNGKLKQRMLEIFLCWSTLLVAMMHYTPWRSW